MKKWQSMRNVDKEDVVKTQSVMVVNIESKYQAMITELKDQQKLNLKSLESRNHKMRAEIGTLTQQLKAKEESRENELSELETKLLAKEEREKSFSAKIS